MFSAGVTRQTPSSMSFGTNKIVPNRTESVGQLLPNAVVTTEAYEKWPPGPSTLASVLGAYRMVGRW